MEAVVNGVGAKGVKKVKKKKSSVVIKGGNINKDLSPLKKIVKAKKLKMENGVNGVVNNSPSNNKQFASSSPIDKTPTVKLDCLEGMTGPELIMVRRLAGNDPLMRKKTLRKLRKWLTVLSEKVPDSTESRTMIEPNFVRVWKALFYCMWMADKPLPQEQLAESMSDLQNIFAKKTTPFLLFVEWFVRTMAREWSWIDRFRMDKFMMLFRRFIRKTLVVLSDRKWHNDVLEGFMKIVAVHIFNRHPNSPKKQKDLQQRNMPVTTTPLGLQIHFTDIFMEELAKVGGSSLKFPKILKILTVFMNELGRSNDDRLLDEIRERIFNHLMRQSDVALDYEEEKEGGGGDDLEGEEEEGVGEEEEEEEAEGLEEDDEYLEEGPNGVLDPRAGAVDVILPQLDVDYSKLYEKLVEFGGNKEIKLKNRRILYSLASQFRELTEGKYPLALPEDAPKAPAIPRKAVKKAAKELMMEEMEEEGFGKRRKTKKERKRDAKKRKAMNASADSVGSEDNSEYIQDEDLLEHVSDNYMSYLADQLEGNEGEGEEATAEAEDDAVDGEEEEETEVEEKIEKERRKKRKWKTEVEVEEPEQEEPSTPGGLEEEEKEEVIVVKRPKLGRRASLGSSTVASSTPLKGKARRRLSELRTPTSKNANSILATPGSVTKSANKRVSFVLAKNLEHPHADYPVSIARSPAIPYDKHKRPSTAGLLKSPATTPKSTPIRRAAALDFF